MLLILQKTSAISKHYIKNNLNGRKIAPISIDLQSLHPSKGSAIAWNRTLEKREE